MKKLLFILFIQLILISCGSGDDPVLEDVKLGAFELVYPEKNTLCTEGTIISDTEISIPLKWETSENATSYKVVVTNTVSGAKVEKTVTVNSLGITLPKGTKFSWNVTSILKDKTKLSNDSWDFYSEGVSVSNHVPFPVSITLEDNKDGTININWVGTDLDNDILNYQVYLGTSESTALLIEETENESIQKQHIEYDTLYFLKIITIDENGNSSSSTKEFNF